MQVKEYIIEILSPIVLTSLSGDENIVTTEKVISGTSLLGAISAEYIQEKNLQNAHLDAKFYEWFLSGNISFSNFYPIVKDDYGDYPLQPTPFYFQHPKGEATNYDNVFINKKENTSYKTKEDLSVMKNGKVFFQNPTTKYNFHHERDYVTGITKKGKIFTYESIEPGHIFYGTISGGKEEFFNWLGKEKVFYIGRSKNSQYGKIRFKPSDREIEPQEEIQLEDNEFILTFTTDVILTNEFGFPTTEMQSLQQYFQPYQVEIKDWITKQKPIEGFHSAWKLRKLTDISLKAGTSLLLKCNSNERESLQEKLQGLSNVGIGLRTNEGFGRFTIMDFQSNLDKIEDGYKLVTFYGKKGVEVKLSKEARKLIENIYKEELFKLASKKAMDDIGKLDNLIRKGDRASFVSHILAFIDNHTGKFDYKRNKKDKSKKAKVLNRPLERNVERYSIEGKFLFEYFADKLSLTSLVHKGSEMEELREDYDFLKNLDLEIDLNLKYFKTFVSALRKKIKEKNTKGEKKDGKK